MHTVVHNVVWFVKKGGIGKRLKLFFVPPMENTLEAPLIYQLFILYNLQCHVENIYESHLNKFRG